jgi:hypothetical protein
MHESPIMAVVAGMLEGTIELSCVSRTPRSIRFLRLYAHWFKQVMVPLIHLLQRRSCNPVRQGDICERVSHDAMESIENTGGIASLRPGSSL